MKSKIALVEVWLGEIPDYFQYHIQTIKNLKTIDFFFFTDDQNYDFKDIVSNNINIIKIDEENFLDRFYKYSGIRIEKITNKRKIIDFKLSYFGMFQEYIEDYSYVGIYDIDTLFGDLDSVLHEYINNYDFISIGDDIYCNRLSGPLLIMRNRDDILVLLKTERYFETLLSEEIYGYGENELSVFAKNNYKVKLIDSTNLDLNNGGKINFDVYWNTAKIYINDQEKLFYHFYNKNETKLKKCGNIISGHYDKKFVDDFFWVILFSENYEKLIPDLMSSIKKFSNRKCLVYTINYTPDFIFKKQFESEQFIFKNITISKGDIDQIGRDQNILNSKPIILIDAINSFPQKKFVYIDTDIYLTTNSDNIVKFFSKLENYPLINSHIHDVMYRSNVIDGEEWTSPLHILLREMSIGEVKIYPRRKTNVIVFDKNSLWFFKEQMDLYEKYKNSVKGIFLFHDEDSANALLNKYNLDKSLPIVDIEEAYNLNIDKIHNYSYNMTNISLFAELPSSLNDFLFFHGFKLPSDYSMINNEYGNTVIDCEEILLSYYDNTIFFKKNSFLSTKKIDDLVYFIIKDLHGNLLFKLDRQEIKKYWTFYVSDFFIPKGLYQVEIFNCGNNLKIYNNILEI